MTAYADVYVGDPTRPNGPYGEDVPVDDLARELYDVWTYVW